MESSFITGDMASISAAPAGQDVRKRWLVLALALVVGLVAAFAIGSAVKKTSAPAAPTGSLAQSSSAAGQHATITPLTNAGAVPALHAPPPKPKVKKTTPANTSSTPSSSSSSVASSSVSSSPSTQSSSPTVSSAPVTSAPSHSAGSTSSGSTSSGTSGISHGGGGGQSAG